METRFLEYFVVVAAEESVTRAAHKLVAAQSTVSVGLRHLERDLGVELFERSARSVRITEAGERLLPEAKLILAGVERLHADARDDGEGISARLRLGTFAGMEQASNLPFVLRDFRTSYPNIDIMLSASHQGTTGIAQELLKNRLDAAFLSTPPPPELAALELGSVPFVAIVPPDHPFAARGGASLADLAGEIWVDVPSWHGARVQLERTLIERGLVRQVHAEVSGLAGLPPYVASGQGIAVVPDVLDVSGCVKIEITDAMPPWRLFLAMIREAVDRPPLRALAEKLGEGFRLNSGVNSSGRIPEKDRDPAQPFMSGV